MTGRLTATLGARTRRVVYGELDAAALRAELPAMTLVDRAHLVMLAERDLVAPAAAGALLREIDELAAAGWAPLAGRPAPRGLYLMYEGWLVERLGPDAGGVLQTGRSRNDLKATVTALGLRDLALELATEATRLRAVLLARARAHRDVVMPVHTHFQAAMPVTYGWYLLGIAVALARDVDAVLAAVPADCPLGAGAVAGTDLPIDPARTAALLGFARPAPHALDAVASRDVPLRLLGAAAGLAVTLSRLATDLQLWSSAEFGYVRFPDRLVGGSSAMPQKRNAFLLEHVKAKPAVALGGWAAAAAAMAAAPFTNSIEVGTEAVAAVRPGLAAALDSVLLTQVLVAGARPVPDRMAAGVRDGFTAATALANRLVRSGVPFRTAHTAVGDAVRRAVDAGSTDLAGHGPPGWLDGITPFAPAGTGPDGAGGDGAGPDGAPAGAGTGIDLGALVAAHAYGGGPGGFAGQWDEAVAGWVAARDGLTGRRVALAAADAELAAAVATWRRR